MTYDLSLQRVDKVLFTNASVVNPESGRSQVHDVVVEDGCLREVGKIASNGFDGEIVDVRGKVLCPGLIDMHVHLREPGREDEETVESGSNAAMAGGFTSICAMPNTEPAADKAEVVKFLKERARGLLVDVLPIAAVTVGRAGEELTEMGELVKAGAVAFSDDGDPVATAGLMRRAMEYAGMFDVPIIEHCEDKSLSTDGVMNESAISTRLGLPGIPGLSEDVAVARNIQIAEFTGARLHIAHISTARSVDLVRQAKQRGVRVTCEVTPHHFTLSDKAIAGYDSNFKMNPPLRTEDDVAAMITGLKDGAIDVIATDHAPHSIEEKEVEFANAPFGIVGLETALGLIFKFLVDPGILTLEEAIRKMTVGPADVLGLARGRLTLNKPASLTVFAEDAQWTVDRESFQSRSKNTPFDGWDLQGRVCALYNNGRLWRAHSANAE